MTPDELDTPLAPDEFAALVSRLEHGAQDALAKSPPVTPAVIHLRVGPRARCTPFTRGVDSKGRPWVEWSDEAGAELTTDEALVTCEACKAV